MYIGYVRGRHVHPEGASAVHLGGSQAKSLGLGRTGKVTQPDLERSGAFPHAPCPVPLMTAQS